MFEDFFERYAMAFLSDDLSGLLAFYGFPMVFYTETGEVLVFEEKDFIKNAKMLTALYKRIGVKSIAFDIQSDTKLSRQLRLVSIVWTFRNAKGNDIYQTVTRYVLNCASLRLAIKAVFVVDETSQLNSLLS